jgi:hypothetical protein
MAAKVIAFPGADTRPYDTPQIDCVTMHRVEHHADGSATLTVWSGIAPWKFHLTRRQRMQLRHDLLPTLKG